MPTQIFHFGPLQGLNASSIAEEAGLQGTYMRGGYNVELIDKEWWVRNGLGDISGSFGTIPLKWALQGPFGRETFFLCGPSHVFIVSARYDQQPGLVLHRDNLIAGLFTFSASAVFIDPFYPEIGVWKFAATRGSRVLSDDPPNGPISGGLGSPGRFFFYNPPGSISPIKVYRVVALTPQILLDRPFEDADDSSFTAKIWDPALPVPADGQGGTPEVDCCGGVVLFEQTVDHDQNTLGYNNDEIQAGLYVILSSSQGIAAVPVGDNHGAPVVHDFVRQTQLAAPTSLIYTSGFVLSFPALKCEVYKDRLFVACRNPIGTTANERTIAYSRPFDIGQWHTGLQNLGGTCNFIVFSDASDPVTGLGILGDGLIVHRRDSQEVMQTYGNGFRSYRSRSGFGVWPKGQFVNTPQGHIGWSKYGPILVSSEGISVIFPEIERMLQAMFVANQELIGCHSVIHDPNRRVVYFVLGFEEIGESGDASEPFPFAFGQKLIVRHHDAEHANPQTLLTNPDGYQYYSRSPVLVVDYARTTCWLEDYPAISGGGALNGQAYFFRYDGRVLGHPTGWSGKDYVVDRDNEKHTIDAQVETQWMEHGTAQRKSITKLYLTMRSLDTNDVAEIFGKKFNPQRISDLWDAETDTLHLCTVEILADQDDDYVRASTDVSMAVSDMLARSLEGNRGLPPMQFDVPIRASGRSFKYRFKNTLSDAARAAGHMQGHFRIVDIVAEMQVESGTVAARFTGDHP